MVPRCYRYTKPVCSNDMKIDEKLPWKEGTSGSREEKREDNGALGWREGAQSMIHVCMQRASCNSV